MLSECRVSYILRQPLRMSESSLTTVIFWISCFKFFAQPRGDTIPDQIIRIVPDDVRAIDLHSFPLPAPESEHLLVKLVGEALRPRREFLVQVCVENRL